jgi:hypothetical protein
MEEAMPSTKKSSAAKRTASTKKQVIGTRVKITLDDSRSKECLILETPTDQMITLSSARGTIEIADGLGNSITLEPAGITIRAANKVTINATELKVNATNLVIDSAISKFNGVVQCDTLISNSVISASYSPGPGNLL